ncbi:MAG TPA: serine/threonine-protein kinase [Thermoleophilaceae bacterium]|nr:serine/threonine-protein kinase [Thermoleophilaceae bacterium]
MTRKLRGLQRPRVRLLHPHGRSMAAGPAAGSECCCTNTEDEMERSTARTESLGHRSEVIGQRASGSDHGFVLGRYRLDRRLGAGGYGVVWLAWDEKLEREVAVKVIPREAEGPAPVRAEREARVAARLNHPGIVSLYELGSDDEAVYLVSELVRGRTFAELLQGGALSDRDIARIGIALCQALQHAHEKGVIHRDVKPQNVMVVAEPAAGAGFAKLTDFGVAHLAESDLTRTGDVVGTLAYMAPEQAEGERVTGAVDVYALALTLYEGWTGSNPVKARGPAATARNLGRSLPRLRSRRRDLPERLCLAIDAALDPRPERRPSLEVLQRTLEHAEDELTEEGGLVEAATLKRFGLAEREPRGLRQPVAVPARAVAAVAAGLLVFLALQLLGPAPPVAPIAAAGAAALAVALLPRIGWLAAAVGVIGWLGTQQAGTALVLVIAAAAVPLLLFRAGALWSVPGLAPALGAIGLAPAYMALAGMSARSAWRRAGLGAAGFLWIVAAEVVTGRSLLYGPAHGTQPRPRWDGSLTHAVAHAIFPTLTSAALAPAAVFAAGAVLLPLAVRGRNLTFDVILAAAWAAGVVAALHALDGVLASDVRLAAARGETVGALLGAGLAVAAAHVRTPLAPVTPSTVP